MIITTLQVFAAANKLSIGKIEKKHGIPTGLLKAIINVESKGCPYAVYYKRKSFLFKDKNNAVRYVDQNWAKGGRNINVGLTQINLQYHKDAKSTSDWFDPHQNAEYAARFLASLRKRLGSWKRAVEYYHAGNNSQHYKSYLRKVNRHLSAPI